MKRGGFSVVIYGFSHTDGDTTFNFTEIDNTKCMLVSVYDKCRNEVEEIRIPENVVNEEGNVLKVSKLDKMAFSAFTALKDLYIPKTVTEIHCDAFLFVSGKITVHSQKGSCAEIWAKSKGFDFKKDDSDLNRFLNNLNTEKETIK